MNDLSGRAKPADLLDRWSHVLVLGLFVSVTVRRAWMCDDAYITFRVVDNFLNGYGLRWNVVERVQVYTHPLWMLIISFLYRLTHELYDTVLVLSVLTSLAALVVLSAYVARSRFSALLGIMVLALSRTFVDYSTSGLENPLTHLLLAVFFGLFFLRDLSTARSLFWLSLVVSLGGLNRLDTLLLFLPPLAYTWYAHGRARGLYPLLLGQFPLILWSTFSLFYYGFIFPNSAYAKLNTGLSMTWLFEHGVYYLIDFVRFDPIAALTIAGSVGVVLLTKERRGWPIIIGMACYVLYIIRIGGDFMSGRFFAAPLLCAVVLMMRSDCSRWPLPVKAVSIIVLVGAGIATESPLHADPRSPAGREFQGIVDERDIYVRSTGLFADHDMDDHPWSRKGRQYAESGSRVIVERSLGIVGYYAGPAVHLIDLYALADALLARLPARRDPWMRVGHYERTIPVGYVQSIESGSNRIADPDLAAYYDKLALITRRPIWDRERLAAIWHMNIGSYDHLLDGAVDR